MDLYPKTRLEFEQIKTKSDEVQYREKIVTKRNDSQLNNKGSSYSLGEQTAIFK